MSLIAKKVEYIFEEPLNFWLALFPSVVDSRRKQKQAEETS